jgi:aryl-alcohol dehydrogenase-like predicted oxidoreductase
MGVIPWSPLNGGWLTGKYRRGIDAPADSRFARLAPMRPMYSLDDAMSQRKFDLLDELTAIASDAGTSLIHLSVAFVLEHPAVTSAIVGPRTMEQFEDHLGAEELVLDGDLLDRIDALVPPGTDVDARDAYYQPPAIATARLRRRHRAD